MTRIFHGYPPPFSFPLIILSMHTPFCPFPDGSSESEHDSRRKRRRKSPAPGVKRFRKRGPRHGDLKPLRAIKPLYAELLNYRHYHLEKRSHRSNRHTAKASHQIKNLGLIPHRFTCEDPILVLDFLRRFIGEA